MMEKKYIIAISVYMVILFHLISDGILQILQETGLLVWNNYNI